MERCQGRELLMGQPDLERIEHCNASGTKLRSVISIHSSQMGPILTDSKPGKPNLLVPYRSAMKV